MGAKNDKWYRQDYVVHVGTFRNGVGNILKEFPCFTLGRPFLSPAFSGRCSCVN